MEERIQILESFQKKWKFYFGAVVIVFSIFTFFFGWKAFHLTSILKNIEAQQVTISKRLNEQINSTAEIEHTAKNALLIAGDIETAVKETKRVRTEIETLVNKIETLRNKTNEEILKAKETNNEASAILTVLNNQLRDIELKVVSIIEEEGSRISSSTLGDDSSLQELKVTLTGKYIKIRFKEGKSIYDEVSISQDNYKGVVFVPPGFYAKVVGDCFDCDFIVTKELEGRVFDSLKGDWNEWKFDDENKTNRFLGER